MTTIPESALDPWLESGLTPTTAEASIYAELTTSPIYAAVVADRGFEPGEAA